MNQEDIIRYLTNLHIKILHGDISYLREKYQLQIKILLLFAKFD